VLAPVLLLALAPSPSPSWESAERELWGLDVDDARAEHLVPPIEQERSKKASWRAEKVGRHDVHLTDRQVARTPAKPITTLYNVWTHEALPVLPGEKLEGRFPRFLRDHYTNQATAMDVRLVEVLTKVAQRFRATRLEVVSGYRSPKYNLILRKKGHQVAKQSQHTEGNAVDFRVRGVPTQVLLRYVKSLRRGGVGYYPHSQFVHSDTGRIRYWKGT
jgi:uncharacterized protein YcbK (DUF882 family)